MYQGTSLDSKSGLLLIQELYMLNIIILMYTVIALKILDFSERPEIFYMEEY